MSLLSAWSISLDKTFNADPDPAFSLIGNLKITVLMFVELETSPYICGYKIYSDF